MPVKVPVDKMDCVAAGKRPAVNQEHVINWPSIKTVEVARQEHEAFVKVLRDREGVITSYIVRIEDQLFECAQDATWLRKRQEELKD